MNRRIANKILLACMCIVLTAPALWAAAPPPEGGILPDFTLSTPKNGGERDYLGLSSFSGSFKIPALKTQVVLIEIFSMYCPYCQAEAPVVNRLHEKIEANSALKGKIKIMGIGVGNSAYEVDVFKNKYRIPFPLFPDKDFKIYDKVGEVRTPYFIGIRINPDGSHRVIYSRLGALGDVDQFLREIVRRGNVK